MATVCVRATRYVAGDLPARSVISGLPTPHRERIATPVDEGDYGSGWLAPRLNRFVEQLGRFRPGSVPARMVLVGEVPVTQDEVRDLNRRRLVSRAAAWASGAVLVVNAWAGHPWAPLVAVVAIAGLTASLVASVVVRRRWPRVSVDLAGRWVTLDRVHDDFAAALEAQPDTG